MLPQMPSASVLHAASAWGGWVLTLTGFSMPSPCRQELCEVFSSSPHSRASGSRCHRHFMPSAAASSRGTAVEDEEFPGSRRGRSGTPASAKGARTASSTSCGRRKVSGCSSTLRITDVQRVLPLRQGKLGPVFSDGSCSLVHEAELSFEALLPSGRFCPESFYFVT